MTQCSQPPAPAEPLGSCAQPGAVDALDERQLVRALTEVLRQQRLALANGGAEGAAPVAPIWQPLIDALQRYTARRQAGDGALPSSPELAAEVAALRDETLALQHLLTVWSAALQQAIAQSQRRDAASSLVYGPVSAPTASRRQTLARG